MDPWLIVGIASLAVAVAIVAFTVIRPDKKDKK